MLLFCEAPKVVDRWPCETCEIVIWHPGDYFVTSYCDEWQLFDGWKIIFRPIVDDSLKTFDQKWRFRDSYRVVIWWLIDYFVTSICEGHPHKSSSGDLVTILCHVTTQWQPLILKAKDHQFDKFVVTGGTAIFHNDNLQCHEWWQCCQIDDPLSSNITFRLCDDLLPKVTTIWLKARIKQLHGYMSGVRVHTSSQ